MIVVICGRLFYQLGRVYWEVPAAMNAIQSDEQWLQRLRADAWAAQVATIDEQGILTFAGTEAGVRWSLEPGFLRRDEDGVSARWPVGHPIKFERERNLCVLRSNETLIALPHAKRGER